MFSQAKTAQMAASFLSKANGQLNIVKLMKLLYLAEREALEKFGFSISDDRFVSMNLGPVLSDTYNLINGEERDSAVWDEWISDRAQHSVALNREINSRDDLDELSNAELSVIETIWQRFGHMTQWELVDYTHQHLPEWRNPNGSSTPIEVKDILQGVGYASEQSEQIAESIQSARTVKRVLSRL